MDNNFIGSVDDWIKHAEEDFGFASINLEDPQITYYAQICFHYQQAAEKYLKAFIVKNQLLFKKIHDLDSLRGQCEEIDAEFAVLKEDCIYLNDFYIEPRYPVVWPANLERSSAIKAKESTQKIKDFVLKKLEKQIE